MARDKKFAPNIDNSQPLVYPNGRIQDNTGSGNGTPVNNYVYSDLHEMKDKLMRLYGVIPNGRRRTAQSIVLSRCNDCT